MKKFITTLLFLVGFNAQAAVISLQLDNPNINLGESTQLTIAGTGFAAFDTLNVDIEFDTSLFSFDSLSVGGDLFAATPFIFEVTEQAYGVAVSFLDFVPFAGGDFTIASFNLTAIALGSSGLELANIIVADSITLVTAIAANETTSLVANEVPEPTSLVMMFSGLLLLMARRQSLLLK